MNVSGRRGWGPGRRLWQNGGLTQKGWHPGDSRERMGVTGTGHLTADELPLPPNRAQARGGHSGSGGTTSKDAHPRGDAATATDMAPDQSERQPESGGQAAQNLVASDQRERGTSISHTGITTPVFRSLGGGSTKTSRGCSRIRMWRTQGGSAPGASEASEPQAIDQRQDGQ